MPSVVQSFKAGNGAVAWALALGWTKTMMESLKLSDFAVFCRLIFESLPAPRRLGRVRHSFKAPQGPQVMKRHRMGAQIRLDHEAKPEFHLHYVYILQYILMIWGQVGQVLNVFFADLRVVLQAVPAGALP